MRRLRGLFILMLIAGLLAGCSRSGTETPFTYPFIKELHLERTAAPWHDYQALYVLTEDFEPTVDSADDIEQMRDGLRFAAELSAKYQIPWTHFVDVNTLAPAFIAEDAAVRRAGQEMIGDLRRMIAQGDDCELHLHGALDERLLASLRQSDKLHAKVSGIEKAQPYRQRHSFFFNAFYAQGYRNLVISLTYGKRLLEKSLYDNKQAVVAFRPGGWDHGSSMEDTRLYYTALLAAGLRANSGLSTGNFAATNWRVGNDTGHNLATITLDDKSVIEVSPTAAPGWYVNPVVSQNIRQLAEAAAKNRSNVPVIVSVYHLGALQKIGEPADADDPSPNSGQAADRQQQRAALERHFQLLSDLRAKKIIYPITLRELLTFLSQPPPDAVMATDDPTDESK